MTGKDILNHQRKEIFEKNKPADGQRMLRSSIDEAIEATITRYTIESPAVISDANSDSSCNQQDVSSSQRSVIVTPKKRHRMQDLITRSIGQCNLNKSGELKSTFKNGDGRTVPISPGKTSPQLGARHTAPNFKNLSAAPGKCDNSTSNQAIVKAAALLNRECIKLGGIAEPKRRSGSRNPHKDLKPEKQIFTRLEIEKSKTDESPVKTCEKGKRNVTSKVNESSSLLKIVDGISPQAKITDRMRNTRSNSKPESDVSDYVHTERVDRIEKAESKTSENGLRSQGKLPVAGIFEPSSLSVEIDSTILVPMSSPSEILKVKSSIGLKKLKNSDVLKMVKTERQNENSKGKVTSKYMKAKKIKPLRTFRDVRVNLEAIKSTDLLTKAAEQVKKKARRRKTINRTGFPNKKKKKKVYVDIVGAKLDKTVTETVIPPNESLELSPKSEKTSTRLAEKRLTKQEDSQNQTTKKLKLTPHENSDLAPIDSKIKAEETAQGESKQNDEESSGRVCDIEDRTVSKMEDIPNGTAKLRRVRKNGFQEGDHKKIKTVAKKMEKTLAENEKRTEDEMGTEIPCVVSVRKRKRLNTIKSTNTSLKTRYQYPLLSMKKFKKAKEDSRAPRYNTHL